jgi:hypothetical protein
VKQQRLLVADRNGVHPMEAAIGALRNGIRDDA